jgi:hypothetical protein
VRRVVKFPILETSVCQFVSRESLYSKQFFQYSLHYPGSHWTQVNGKGVTCSH